MLALLEPFSQQSLTKNAAVFKHGSVYVLPPVGVKSVNRTSEFVWRTAFPIYGFAVYKKEALAQTVQQYDFPDKNFVNKVYTHRLNELFAASAPQLIGIPGLVVLFAE